MVTKETALFLAFGTNTRFGAELDASFPFGAVRTCGTLDGPKTVDIGRDTGADRTGESGLNGEACILVPPVAFVEMEEVLTFARTVTVGGGAPLLKGALPCMLPRVTSTLARTLKAPLISVVTFGARAP